MTHTHLLSTALMSLALLGSACSSEDPTIDEQLVGTWERRSGDTVDDAWVFRDDGTFSFDEFGDGESADHVSGTWSVEGDRLIMAGRDGDTTADYDLTYFADDNAFAFDALLPVGANEGLVGRWRGAIRFAVDGPGEDDDFELDSEVDMTLRADGTATFTRINHVTDETFETEATWGDDEEEPGRYEVSYQPSEDFTITHSFDLLGTPGRQALAGTIYLRAQ